MCLNSMKLAIKMKANFTAKEREQLKEIFQALFERKELTTKQVELWNKYNKKRGEDECQITKVKNE